MKKNEIELTDVEVMEEEIPLEKKIENALVKENVTEKVIAELENRYAGMKLSSLEDKDMYLQIKDAKKNVRAIGIIVEKTCKKGREDAIKTQKLWLATEKKHLDRIDKVQLPLEAEIKKFDDEVQRKENEEKELKEAAFQQRQSTLIKYGAHYNNGSFELNHISYEIDNIRESDQEIWESIILPKYKAEFEKLEAIKVAHEKEREAAALKLKQEQEDLKAQQIEMDRQKKELAEAQSAMQRMKDDAEREKRTAAQKENDEFIRKHREKIGNRAKQLQALGLFYSTQYDSYVFEDVAVSRVVEIEGMDDGKWNEMVAKITPTIERNKKELEEKRIADAEAQKKIDIEVALQKERDRVAKEKADAELKEAHEKKRKEEELSQGRDKRKWEEFLRQLNEVDVMEMNSTIYKRKAAIAKEKIEEILSL